MIKIDRALSHEYGSWEEREAQHCRLVNMLHDELIFEVRQDIIDRVAVIVRDCMVKAVELTVPLEVKIKTGTSWGSLQPWKPREPEGPESRTNEEGEAMDLAPPDPDPRAASR